MNKATKRAIDKALMLVVSHPAYAANSLAGLHRAASKADQREIEGKINIHGLGVHLDMINGCYVAKA